MHIALRTFFSLLSVALGAVFLYSGYTKLVPIQPFEYTLVERLHFPWMVAAIVARLLIGIEFGLGALLVLQLTGKGQWVVKWAVGLLLAFSVYLAGLWLVAGNDVDCGCFGDSLFMRPSSSLLKNAALLLVSGLLIRYHKGLHFRYSGSIIIALLLVGAVLPFILFAIPASQPNWLRKDSYKIDFTPVYQPANGYLPDTQVVATAQLPDLRKGKHIVAFISQGCMHCRIAAQKMHLMKQQQPSLPFFLIIAGTSPLDDFWKHTQARDIPYTRMAKEPFLQYTGGQFPIILWVNNGWVEATADYNTLSKEEILTWLSKK